MAIHIDLTDKKICDTDYFLVGYDAVDKRYILEKIVTWVAWYSRYYSISKEEYELFDTDIEKLKSIANECNKAAISHQRFIGSENLRDEIVKVCDECASRYYANSSKMESLCPNCAHYLYAYENCLHKMKDSRCKICGWDGTISPFIAKLKNNK